MAAMGFTRKNVHVHGSKDFPAETILFLQLTLVGLLFTINAEVNFEVTLFKMASLFSIKKTGASVTSKLVRVC